jgi:hypothetical protein
MSSGAKGRNSTKAKSPSARSIANAGKDLIRRSPTKRGGIVEALLRSPLAGTDLKIERPRTSARKVDL